MEIKKRVPRLAWACRHRTLAIRRDLATTGSGSSALCSRMRHLALVAFHASLSALSPTGSRWHVHAHTLDGQTLYTVTFTFCQSPRCTDRSRDSTGQLDHYQTTMRGLLYDKAFFFPKIPSMPGYLFWFQRLLLINPFSLESKMTRDLT